MPKLNPEIERLKKAISLADQCHQYNGNLVANLLAEMGLIHKSRQSMARWGRSY